TNLRALRGPAVGSQHNPSHLGTFRLRGQSEIISLLGHPIGYLDRECVSLSTRSRPIECGIGSFPSREPILVQHDLIAPWRDFTKRIFPSLINTYTSVEKEIRSLFGVSFLQLDQ